MLLEEKVDAELPVNDDSGVAAVATVVVGGGTNTCRGRFGEVNIMFSSSNLFGTLVLFDETVLPARFQPLSDEDSLLFSLVVDGDQKVLTLMLGEVILHQ